MKNPFSRRPVVVAKPQPRPKPNKKRCVVRFKKTEKGEDIVIEGECNQQQIEMAREMRKNQQGDY